MQKWNNNTAVDIDEWLSSGKINFDKDLRIMIATNDYGYDKYHGQVNDQGQYHGIGRLCRVSGQIYEGNFFEGCKHGWGRDIEFHSVYSGKFDMDKKLDDENIEWSTGPSDSYFDQSLLRAKAEMTSGLKDQILQKMDSIKKSRK
jgi:hypothetical protein